MKNVSSKALICALLTSLLLFTTNVISAESKIITNTEVMQQNVYLNKSTIDELMTLKGIGHKKAQAILGYRKQIGSFTSVSELIKVKGIGKKILSDNKERLKI